MDELDRTTPPGLQHETGAIADSAVSTGAPPFRADVYWHYLEAMDLTEEQKNQLLQTLWSIMAGFVDLGFGVDPVQQILPALVQATLEIDRNTLEPSEACAQFGAAAANDVDGGSTHDNYT